MCVLMLEHREWKNKRTRKAYMSRECHVSLMGSNFFCKWYKTVCRFEDYNKIYNVNDILLGYYEMDRLIVI